MGDRVGGQCRGQINAAIQRVIAHIGVQFDARRVKRVHQRITRRADAPAQHHTAKPDRVARQQGQRQLGTVPRGHSDGQHIIDDTVNARAGACIIQRIAAQTVRQRQFCDRTQVIEGDSRRRFIGSLRPRCSHQGKFTSQTISAECSTERGNAL